MRIRSLVKIQFSSWFFNLLCVDGRMDHVLTIPNIRFNEVEKCLRFPKISACALEQKYRGSLHFFPRS